MEPEDFEDYTNDIQKETVERMIKESEKKFSEGCMEGYILLEQHGAAAVRETEEKEATEALNRMMGYFIQMEEYEKCSVIQRVFREAFNVETTPIFPNFLI